MKKLTKIQLNEIENQMFNKAIDIDVALFNYLSGSMSNEFVLYALSMYQNRDGGMGHNLSHDNLNNKSSVYETLKSLEILKMAGFDYNCLNEEFTMILKKIFNYLFNKNTNWRLFDKSNLEFACAKRFQEESDIRLDSLVCGYAIYFLDKKSPFYRKAIANLYNLDAYLLGKDNLSEDELIGYNMLFKALKLRDEAINEEAYYYFNNLKSKTLEEDINQYNYDLMLELLDKDENKSLEESLISFLLDNRSVHGLWEAADSWGNDYPEAESASLKKIGRQSVKNIYLLKKFIRIEE